MGGAIRQEFLNKVLRADLERVLDALPEAFRIVVILSDLEGFNYQEIAGMLDVPVGTVRSRLSRARAIQKMLWNRPDHGLTTPTQQREIRNPSDRHSEAL